MCLYTLGRSLIMQSTQNHPECQIPPAQSDGNNKRRGRQSSLAAEGWAQDPQQVEGVHHPVSVEYNLRLFHFRPLALCTAQFTELHHSLPHLQKTCHLIPAYSQCILLRASNSFLSIFVLLITQYNLLQGSLEYLNLVCQL